MKGVSLIFSQTARSVIFFVNADSRVSHTHTMRADVVAVVGSLVVWWVSSYTLRINLAVALRYARRHSWWTLRRRARDVRTMGIVRAARAASHLVPYGFTRPLRWSECRLGDASLKRDALPTHVIELLTFHHPLSGRRIGTSLFIEPGPLDVRERRKRLYTSALDTASIDGEYRRHMRDALAERCENVVVVVVMVVVATAAPTTAAVLCATSPSTRAVA